MPPAGKVDRKMKGRLQSGGAVLWFLRKHAPMPTPFSSITPVERMGESRDDLQPQAEVPPRPNTSCGFSLDNPQQQFLHNAVKCIGTELEEMHPSAAALMRVRGGHTAANRTRQALKQAFSKHSESECDRLRNEVSVKEAEVRELRLKVQQMERWVQATKHATQKRNARARAAAGGDHDTHRKSSKHPPPRSSGHLRPSEVPGQQRGSIAPSHPRASSAHIGSEMGVDSLKIHKAEQAYRTESDAINDEERAGEDNKESLVKRAEEWQHAIARQSDVVKVLKTKIVDAESLLNRSTVQKKSIEMSLFLAESEILKLRANTKTSEDRATELANELKRVYCDLPKVMEKRVKAVAKTTSIDVKKQQLAKLQQENREEHFKFLDTEALTLESKSFEERAANLKGFVERAEEFMKGNRESAKSLEKRTTDARELLGYTQQVWTKMVKRALELAATSGTSSVGVGGGEDMDEGPELQLYRAGSGLDQCLELLSMEGQIDLARFESRSPSPPKHSNTMLSTSGGTKGLSTTQSTRPPSTQTSPTNALASTLGSIF